MNFKRLALISVIIFLVAVIMFSFGCQNQPTGPEGTSVTAPESGKMRSYSSGSCTRGGFRVSFSRANFVTGLGWSRGNGGTIRFSGSCSGCSWGPGVYGWKTNPLVEYYIGKGSGSRIGSYSCNGHGYTLYVLRRNNAPSIQGTKSFDQYNASGSRSSPVNFGCHSYHWQRLGKPSGTHNYQVVAVEGWSRNSGSASVSVTNSNWYTHWVGSGSASFRCGR